MFDGFIGKRADTILKNYVENRRLEVAEGRKDRNSLFLAISGVLFPALIAFAPQIFPNSKPISTIVVIVSIIAHLFFVFSEYISTKVYGKVCEDRNSTLSENSRLKEEIENLRAAFEQEKDDDFAQLFIHQLVQQDSTKIDSLTELADFLVTNIYEDLKAFVGKKQLIVNVYRYSKLDDTIEMIGCFNQLLNKRGFHKRNQDTPHLTTVTNCKKSPYDQYWCVRFAKDTTKDKWILKDWTECVDEFYIKGDPDKKKLKESRDNCYADSVRFYYNQALSKKIYIDENTIVILELMSFRDAVILQSDDLQKNADDIFDKYAPFVELVWMISNGTIRKDENDE